MRASTISSWNQTHTSFDTSSNFVISEITKFTFYFHNHFSPQFSTLFLPQLQPQPRPQPGSATHLAPDRAHENHVTRGASRERVLGHYHLRDVQPARFGNSPLWYTSSCTDLNFTFRPLIHCIVHDFSQVCSQDPASGSNGWLRKKFMARAEHSAAWPCLYAHSF